MWFEVEEKPTFGLGRLFLWDGTNMIYVYCDLWGEQLVEAPDGLPQYNYWLKWQRCGGVVYVAPHYIPFSSKPTRVSVSTPTRTRSHFNYTTQRWELEII